MQVPMANEYLTTSPDQTKRVGQRLAKEILKRPLGKKAVVLALQGELGSGKTTFLQGFAAGLGIKEKILSPTFVLMKKFHVPCPMFYDFYHIDCYRIKSAKEILDLGFKKIISEPKNIVAIEWAENIENILPDDCLKLKFMFVDKQTRKIMLQNNESFAKLLLL